MTDETTITSCSTLGCEKCSTAWFVLKLKKVKRCATQNPTLFYYSHIKGDKAQLHLQFPDWNQLFFWGSMREDMMADKIAFFLNNYSVCDERVTIEGSGHMPKSFQDKVIQKAEKGVRYKRVAYFLTFGYAYRDSMKNLKALKRALKRRSMGVSSRLGPASDVTSTAMGPRW